jgi:translation initiation factor IF-3
VIDQENNQLGVMETNDARRLAQDAGMDLVEVAPQSRPPVCRIMDYGKWKYDQKKKEQKAKVHRHEQTLKEVRMRPKTDAHDQLIKINRAKKFLEKGHKVQFTLLFRGREMVHTDLGRDAFNRIKEELSEIAKVERDFKMEGRRLTMVMAPGKAEGHKDDKSKADQSASA